MSRIKHTEQKNFNLKQSNKMEILQKSIEHLDLRIIYDNKTDVYNCIIKEGNHFYRSENYSLQSCYEQGILQDVLGEIDCSKFFYTFGNKTQHLIKEELLHLLDSW